MRLFDSDGWSEPRPANSVASPREQPGEDPLRYLPAPTDHVRPTTPHELRDRSPGSHAHDATKALRTRRTMHPPRRESGNGLAARRFDPARESLRSLGHLGIRSEEGAPTRGRSPLTPLALGTSDRAPPFQPPCSVVCRYSRHQAADVWPNRRHPPTSQWDEAGIIYRTCCA